MTSDTVNQLVDVSSSASNTPDNDHNKAEVQQDPADDDDETARRKPSTRRRRDARQKLAFSNSLCTDRRAGLAATRGKLSVSFSDQKGLSASDIKDILSGFEDEPAGMKQEGSLTDLFGDGNANDSGRNEISSLMGVDRRAELCTIQSQKSLTFGFDPTEDMSDD